VWWALHLKGSFILFWSQALTRAVNATTYIATDNNKSANKSVGYNHVVTRCLGDFSSFIRLRNQRACGLLSELSWRCRADRCQKGHPCKQNGKFLIARNIWGYLAHSIIHWVGNNLIYGSLVPVCSIFLWFAFSRTYAVYTFARQRVKVPAYLLSPVLESQRWWCVGVDADKQES